MSTYWSTDAPMWIIKESYRPPYAKSRVIEMPLLASTSSAWPYASVVQHEGRDRRHVSFTAHVSDIAYYDSLEADYFAATPNQFVGPDGTTGVAYVIKDLGEPQWLLADDIRFTVLLVEVTT